MAACGLTHVAVVEDDESARRALSRLLRADGMQPVGYASAEAFLADNNQPVFDCLVLDIELGGMSGIQLQRQLKAAGSSTPVVYLTGHGEPSTREQALALGCAAYLSKTSPGKVVVQAIRDAVHPKDVPHS